MVVLEHVKESDIKRMREDEKRVAEGKNPKHASSSGGLASRQYRFTADEGIYVFSVNLLEYGRNRPGHIVKTVTFGHKNEMTTKVTRRVTERAEDEDGNIVADESSDKSSGQVGAPVKHHREDQHQVQKDQEVTTTVTPKVTSGVVDVFGPAGMTVSVQVYDQSGRKVDDTVMASLSAPTASHITDIKPLPAPLLYTTGVHQVG